MLMYVINYGKVLDWMASPKICLYIMIAPILIALFIWYQYHSERPYVNLAPLYQRSTYRLFLYDACHVFQYFDYLVDQLPDQYLKGRQHSYLFPLYLFASGICLGGVICFGGSGGNVAVSFLDSGRNELFRPVSSGALFRDLHRIARYEDALLSYIPQGIGHDGSLS